LTGPDGASVKPTSAMHQALGVGVKATVVKDLTLLAGFDIGLARSVGLGVPATPPWNFCFGASFAIDPFQRGEITFVDTLRERKGSSVALEGVVTDADTKTPVAGVVIAIAGVKPSATNTAGEYRTLELTGDQVKVSASRDGYKPVEKVVTLEAGKPTRLDLEISADKRAVFLVTTTASKKPVKATVAFVGGGLETKLDTDENATEPVSSELPAGLYVITATAEGYLSQTREVQVTPGASLPVAFELVVAPKKSLVVFKGDKIDVLQQVHFATGKATILADSYNLLQQVADAVIKNNVKRLKVEGHTDNRGDKAVNQALSEARARAVADFLVSQGFEKQRVESVGYGDSKPIAPNLTARGRELNRRVEFIIVVEK
jgi:outer membrane protein OmpA-like peptidoglycan-associated protein